IKRLLSVVEVTATDMKDTIAGYNYYCYSNISIASTTVTTARRVYVARLRIKRLLSVVEVTAADMKDTIVGYNYYCYSNISITSTTVTTARRVSVARLINGDSPQPMRTVDGVEETYHSTTAEEKLSRKNELKARGTLLIDFLNEHQLKFNSYKNAMSLMKTIEKKFRGNKESKKAAKAYQPARDSWRNYLSRRSESKVIKNSGNTNQAHGSNSANTDSLSDAMIYSFFVNQSNSPQLDNEDLQQIDANDLEKIDLKQQMAMLTMRARIFLKKTGRKVGANGFETIRFDKIKVECYNYHKKGHFARECMAPRENRSREPAEDGPTNFALMAYTFLVSTSSSNSDTEVSTCSKACLKSYETLKVHYDNLTKDFKNSQLKLRAYKAGLESIEARLDVYKSRLDVYKKNEVVFEKDIKVLKLDILFRDNALTELRKKFKKAKKERDDLKLTLKRFKNSSKNLSNLLDSQICDKFKTGVGFDSQVFDNQVNNKYKTGEWYHPAPPSYTGNFMPPKPDLILTDVDKYIDSEFVTSVPTVTINEAKTSKSKPKSVSEPLIED
nr:hypothetical protein [Tanacetum cinerariifolium]